MGSDLSSSTKGLPFASVCHDTCSKSRISCRQRGSLNNRREPTELQIRLFTQLMRSFTGGFEDPTRIEASNMALFAEKKSRMIFQSVREAAVVRLSPVASPYTCTVSRACASDHQGCV